MKKRLYLVLALIMFSINIINASEDVHVYRKKTGVVFPVYLYSDEFERVYLGKLTTNEFDNESIYNIYGEYGSEYSSTSIWNLYGKYGSEFSNFSAFNDGATNPPLILDNSRYIVGRLTTNKSIYRAVNPYMLKNILKGMGR